MFTEVQFLSPFLGTFAPLKQSVYCWNTQRGMHLTGKYLTAFPMQCCLITTFAVFQKQMKIEDHILV